MTLKSNNDNTLQYKFEGTGLSATERRWGENRFNDYREKYHMENLSDLQILEELVFRECLQEKYKKKIGKLTKKTRKKKGEKDKLKTNTEIVPKYLISALNENLDKILLIKEKLGLFADKTGEDPFKYIKNLKDKFKKWREENQGSRETICPHCSKMVMLKIRTEAWEAQKHPFFKDKILANKSLWKLYKDGKIMKKDVAEILGCSDDYIDWLEEKIYSKDSSK